MATLLTSNITGSLIVNEYLKLETPTLPPDKGGAMDFDPASQKIKIQTYAWSTGPNMNISRYDGGSGGCQSSAWVTNGTGAPGAALSSTEEYNGSAWSTVNSSLNTRGKVCGAGTQNSGLIVGSSPETSTCTEEYNGTSWTAGGAALQPIAVSALSGNSSAALIFGGSSPSPSPFIHGITDSYNGTSWSNTGQTLLTARFGLSGVGSQNSSLAVGGGSPSFTSLSCTEIWNGSTWYSVAGLLQVRVCPTTFGNITQAMVVGSNPTSVQPTPVEEYDGVSWSSFCALSTGCCLSVTQGAGTNKSNGMVFGGLWINPPAAGTSCTTHILCSNVRTWNFE